VAQNDQPVTRARGKKTRADGGLMYGLGAYSAWGVIPLYFRALAAVSPVIILCHRVVWSVAFLVLVISARREWSQIAPTLLNRRKLVLLSAGSILIAANWLIFIYAVSTHQVLQASLGYFINPLLSIALGMIFLGERLRKWQWVAVAVAASGVVNLALRGNGVPWLALSLAASFGLYGLVRKKLNINSLHGLLVETLLLVPVAVVVLVVSRSTSYTPHLLGLLSLSGVITAVPLLMFGAALRRLPLSTMGFLQYVGPTLQFLVALVLFHEPLDQTRLLSFALCWVGIIIYMIDSVRSSRAQELADEPE
jgi:chloramphenicol-sensitive protein RarD